jgi:tripeptidyl-peptidase I
MYLSASLLLALLATGSIALSASSDSFAKTKVFEKPAVVPGRWAKQDAAIAGSSKSNATLELRIHLVAQNMDKFHEMAMDVRIINNLPRYQRLQNRTLSVYIC